MGSDEGVTDPVRFEAVITPHRSLSPNGLRNLVVALMLLSVLVACGLWLAGAWPVIGFTGIEAALAIWLLHRHAAIAGESEVLLLSDSGLHVVRTSRGRRAEMKVPAAWLRARLEERPGRAPALVLRSGQVSIEIATWLGEDEKRDLATALATALERQRSPVFDNEQLRPINSPSAPST